jgi:hypothetical protein
MQEWERSEGANQKRGNTGEAAVGCDYGKLYHLRRHLVRLVASDVTFRGKKCEWLGSTRHGIGNDGRWAS